MADINIERKSGAGSVLPWIIGLLVLALVAWWLLAGRGDDRRAQEGTYVDTTTAPAAGMGAPATTTDPAYDGTGTMDGTTGTGTMDGTTGTMDGTTGTMDGTTGTVGGTTTTDGTAGTGAATTTTP